MKGGGARRGRQRGEDNGVLRTRMSVSTDITTLKGVNTITHITTVKFIFCAKKKFINKKERKTVQMIFKNQNNEGTSCLSVPKIKINEIKRKYGIIFYCLESRSQNKRHL